METFDGSSVAMEMAFPIEVVSEEVVTQGEVGVEAESNTAMECLMSSQSASSQSVLSKFRKELSSLDDSSEDDDGHIPNPSVRGLYVSGQNAAEEGSVDLWAGGVKDDCLCWECGKRFRSLEHLMIHFRTHKASVRCNMCQVTFNRVVSLNLHLDNVHSNISLQCPDCGFTCDSKWDLNEHLGTHIEPPVHLLVIKSKSKAKQATPPSVRTGQQKKMEMHPENEEAVTAPVPVSVPVSVPVPPSAPESVCLPVSVPRPVAYIMPAAVSLPKAIPVSLSAPVSVPRTVPVTLSTPVSVARPTAVTLSTPVSVSQTIPVTLSAPESLPKPVPVALSAPVSVPKSLPVTHSAPITVSLPVPVTVSTTISMSLPVTGSARAPVSVPKTVPEPVSLPVPVCGPVAGPTLSTSTNSSGMTPPLWQQMDLPGSVAMDHNYNNRAIVPGNGSQPHSYALWTRHTEMPSKVFPQDSQPENAQQKKFHLFVFRNMVRPKDQESGKEEARGGKRDMLEVEKKMVMDEKKGREMDRAEMEVEVDNEMIEDEDVKPDMSSLIPPLPQPDSISSRDANTSMKVKQEAVNAYSEVVPWEGEPIEDDDDLDLDPPDEEDKEEEEEEHDVPTVAWDSDYDPAEDSDASSESISSGNSSGSSYTPHKPRGKGVRTRTKGPAAGKKPTSALSLQVTPSTGSPSMSLQGGGAQQQISNPQPVQVQTPAKQSINVTVAQSLSQSEPNEPKVPDRPIRRPSRMYACDRCREVFPEQVTYRRHHCPFKITFTTTGALRTWGSPALGPPAVPTSLATSAQKPTPAPNPKPNPSPNQPPVATMAVPAAGSLVSNSGSVPMSGSSGAVKVTQMAIPVPIPCSVQNSTLVSSLAVSGGPAFTLPSIVLPSPGPSAQSGSRPLMATVVFNGSGPGRMARLVLQSQGLTFPTPTLSQTQPMRLSVPAAQNNALAAAQTPPPVRLANLVLGGIIQPQTLVQPQRLASTSPSGPSSAPAPVSITTPTLVTSPAPVIVPTRAANLGPVIGPAPTATPVPMTSPVPTPVSAVVPASGLIPTFKTAPTPVTTPSLKTVTTQVTSFAPMTSPMPTTTSILAPASAQVPAPKTVPAPLTTPTPLPALTPAPLGPNPSPTTEPLKILGLFVNRSQELALQQRLQKSWRSKGTFLCRHCGAISRQPSLGVRHRYLHRGSRPHRCPCGRAFPRRLHLLRHQVQHAEATRFVCAPCGQTFVGAGCLARHKQGRDNLRKSGTLPSAKAQAKKDCCKPFSCDCGQRFQRPAAFLWHKLKNPKRPGAGGGLKKHGNPRPGQSFTSAASQIANWQLTD
ncbi:hypothetical protein JZ751_018613 [Albula glossodonta]|uniref:C2H2-type domain-containing protein n=1 Tax=Albula glossodonta TaxID=121402 RepID=A0A8T2N518_9TELE|nr:hypothetical protein JZ751_018613 [Albula glossodonta]